jgi:type IV fimbrial biogenesis protein FimT
MLTVAVLSILLGLGVPSFAAVIRNNQIAAASSDVVSALNLARSEAMKRGVRVSICAASAANTCATGAAAADWSTGWVIFEDDFGAAGAIDPGDVPLQNWGSAAPGISIAIVVPSAAASTSTSTITFSRRARAEFARQLTVSKQGCSGYQRRVISIGSSGRVGLTREACSS